MKKTEILLILLLSILIIGVRFYKIDADPPNGLSISSDVYTDPPNLTLHAKQEINNNEFNTTQDNRYTLFINSSITLLAKVFYSITKVSLATSNMIGLFFSLGGLFLFFLITLKGSGKLAGILYLLIIGLNYNQLFYGRLAFQEHSMVFWGFLAIVLIIYSDNKFIAFLGGVSLGSCIFFGKLIGVVFIIPFIVYFLYEIFYQNRTITKIKGIYFLFGFILLTAYWGVFVYLPMQNDVQSYLGEQVYNNHGFPIAFESVSKFIGMYVTFGHASHLVPRMVLGCLLASCYIISVLINIFPLKIKTRMNNEINGIHIFIITLAISYYLFLMIWQYSPLRYQLVLIYPICGSAAIFLSYLWDKKGLLEPKKFTYKIFLILLPISILYSAYIVFELNESILSNSSYELKQFLIYSGMVLFACLSFILMKSWDNINPHLKKQITRTIVILSILIIVSINGYRYSNWAIRPTYTVRDNSIDFQTILEPNALITGSYSSVLTIETKYNSIIHMFGVTKPDPDFFIKFPITHLLVDDGNEQRAREDYPEIMNKAHKLLTYFIGSTQINLIRVAGGTKNRIADNYQLSTFEKLVLANENATDTSFQYLANKFLLKYPKNLSGNLLIAANALKNKNLKTVETSLQNAIEFSPTNYTLLAVLARLYKDLYQKTKILDYKSKGLEYYDKALWLFPSSNRLSKEREELLNNK